jgi:hypothetical protein
MGNIAPNTRENSLSFAVIERPLDSLLIALENKIDREWPRRFAHIDGAREFFLITARLTRNTYDTVRWICADIPKDPQRRPVYSLSVPPLTRTILDSIFTVVFMLEHLPSRCEWYHKAGWREAKLELGRYKSEYGHLPEWQVWLDGLSENIELGMKIFPVTAAEASNPKLIHSWPNPGKMPKYGLKKGEPVPPTRQFLEYLNDWFYRDLSQQSHLGGYGLVKRAGYLIGEFHKISGFEKTLIKFKTAQVSATIALVLALASEIEAYFHFGLAERAKYLWGILMEYSGVTKELYNRRYSSLLSS